MMAVSRVVKVELSRIGTGQPHGFEMIQDYTGSCDDPEYYFRWVPTYCSLLDNTTINLEVAGGIGPFTWEVSGSNFALTESTTAGRTNTVGTTYTVAANDSAVVTVTDNCGNVVTGNIKACAVPLPFCFEVKTYLTDTDFTLPIYSGGTYNFHVDWGDGSSSDITAYDDAEVEHTYASVGTYDIKIYGTLVGWRFYKDGTLVPSASLIYDISEWGILDVGNLGDYFRDCTKLTISATNSPNWASTTDLGGAFLKCDLRAIPTGLFDKCVLAENFAGCFQSCPDIASIPAGLFDNCPLVTSFRGCFSGLTTIKSIPVGLFDSCPLATDFFGCFQNCLNINTDLPINLLLNQTALENCGWMFYKCGDMTGDGTDFVDIAVAHGVTEFAICFTGCTSLDDYGDIPSAWGGGGA